MVGDFSIYRGQAKRQYWKYAQTEISGTRAGGRSQLKGSSSKLTL